MTVIRPPKKSETLEVRIPYAAKLAFMERCRSEGVTASEVVRRLIETNVPNGRRPHALVGIWQAFAIAGAGVVIGAVAVPSIAQALPDTSPTFQQLDADKDGILTPLEFHAR